MAEKVTFEQDMKNLEEIVKKLEQGDIPLEEAVEKFKQGIDLSKKLQNTGWIPSVNLDEMFAKLIASFEEQVEEALK